MIRERASRLRRLSLTVGLALALLPAGLSPISGWASRAASDGPGNLSHFDLARKDCLGTARNTTSKVWFTVANGVLSDVYFPTADNTNVETLQLVVTDGRTFTDLQTRDMTYTVKAPDARSLECQVTSTAKSGRYRITTDYLTDPARNTLLMRIAFEPQEGDNANYHVYLRYDPSINGNGGGGSGNGGGDSGLIDTSTGHAVPVAFDTATTSQAVNRTYAVPVFSALDASRPFRQVSNGFVGAASDGLTQLDASHALTSINDTASNGNLVQTAQLDFTEEGDLTLALGFGTTQAQAVAAAAGSLHAEFDDVRSSFEKGWHAYDASLFKPPAHVAGVTRSQWRQLVNAYYLSANVVKASEDKTFPGAIVASLASPWGQAISAGDPNNLYFGSYREVFARDLYEAWTALMVDGDVQTARAAARFLLERQQLPDGSMPRNSLLNGKVAPDSFNTQLDEVSYPIVMAYQLGMTDSAMYQNHLRPAIDFLIAHGPSFGPERWEEQGGFSPSTIAAEVAGLVAGATIADANGDTATANVARAVADDWQRSLPGWAVTTNGPLASHPYYIRLSKTGDPNAAISYNVGNGGPTLDQRAIIDQGFLEMVRLGLTPASDPTIAQSLPVVDATIKADTSSGTGFHRYNGDGYGDGAGDGHPWAPSGKGTGHLWPALAGERGEYELATGQVAAGWQRLVAMLGGASGPGLIPEQVWELPNLAASPFGTDPTVASIGFHNGGPAGSASPLTWSDAQFVRLMRDLSAGKVLEQPAAVANRYVAHQQGQTSLTVTQPADNSAVSGSPVTVTGTSVPGNTIYVAATNTDNNSQTTTGTTVVQPDGSFTLTVAISGGTTVLNVAAVSPTGATAHVQRSIVFDFTPGTVLLDVTDPSGDDNGPGNYAYPTAGDFHAGAFDIQEFRVIESPDGATTTFKLKVRDLSPTFGSPLGAQLVDVYVHDPTAAAANTSTAASFPQRNYAITAAAAWSRLVEVQGFGQRYVDAQGTTKGTVTISANAISRFITFSVPTASLGGAPASGWGFTVVLTGQDGFSPDQARSFAPTPQAYQFGVCATVSADPHCTFDPNKVPKAMDVLTPAGVVQSNELDYTLHNPVTLQDVVIP
ncbi:MAG TPA: glucodextranase DOMON-like domain-containing protein [Candidatus Dormibacteraeota bacterium]|nr:glucodextranase DOMON-like domain-containing protein [Candidatus Dormibacteraeota bacterium]